MLSPVLGPLVSINSSLCASGLEEVSLSTGDTNTSGPYSFLSTLSPLPLFIEHLLCVMGPMGYDAGHRAGEGGLQVGAEQ